MSLGPGIEPVYLARLEHQGIFTTGLLLEVSETPTRRQYLADQVDALINDVAAWRDEALMLNLGELRAARTPAADAGLYPKDSYILWLYGPDAFRERLAKAASELGVEPPDDLRAAGWWNRPGRSRTSDARAGRRALEPGRTAPSVDQAQRAPQRDAGSLRSSSAERRPS